MKVFLLQPMALYVLYIFILSLLLFRKRLVAIRSGKVAPGYYKTYLGTPPDDLQILGRHYDNQFQAPLIFLIGCTVLLSFELVSMFILVCAWGFVISRALHSYIHLGRNKLQHRVLAFAAGWIFLILLWGRILYFSLEMTLAGG